MRSVFLFFTDFLYTELFFLIKSIIFNPSFMCPRTFSAHPNFKLFRREAAILLNEKLHTSINYTN
jgi:hypothetical protein